MEQGTGKETDLRSKEQAHLKKLWDETISEATAKKVKEEALSEFWMKKRADASK